MYFNQIIAENATDAFERAYRIIESVGEVVESRIGTTKHLPDVTFIIKNPYNNVCLNDQRNMSLRYMLGEISWYMSGSNKVKDIAKYSKTWNNLTDDGETVNSAYGYRIFKKFGFDQLMYCINKLKSNKHDRQAVIHIKEADNRQTKDTPCTCLIQFIVYQNRLNAHVYMRSNDIWLGLPYDVAFFTCLQQIVAKAIGLPCGEYHHTVGDLHLYEKHWNRKVTHTNIDINDMAWDFTEESLESLHEMIEGKTPDNILLKQLWRINCERKEQKN